MFTCNKWLEMELPVPAFNFLTYHKIAEKDMDFVETLSILYQFQ